MSQNRNDICIALGYYTGKIMKSFNLESVFYVYVFI